MESRSAANAWATSPRHTIASHAICYPWAPGLHDNNPPPNTPSPGEKAAGCWKRSQHAGTCTCTCRLMHMVPRADGQVPVITAESAPYATEHCLRKFLPCLFDSRVGLPVRHGKRCVSKSRRHRPDTRKKSECNRLAPVTGECHLCLSDPAYVHCTEFIWIPAVPLETSWVGSRHIASPHPPHPWFFGSQRSHSRRIPWNRRCGQSQHVLCKANCMRSSHARPEGAAMLSEVCDE